LDGLAAKVLGTDEKKLASKLPCIDEDSTMDSVPNAYNNNDSGITRLKRRPPKRRERVNINEIYENTGMNQDGES
jgi:hypothetical protein